MCFRFADHILSSPNRMILKGPVSGVRHVSERTNTFSWCVHELHLVLSLGKVFLFRIHRFSLTGPELIATFTIPFTKSAASRDTSDTYSVLRGPKRLFPLGILLRPIYYFEKSRFFEYAI